MRCAASSCLLALLATAASAAGPAADLRQAIRELHDGSGYAWEVRVASENDARWHDDPWHETAFRPVATGEWDERDVAVVTVFPRPTQAMEMTVIYHNRDAVVFTPLGWLTREEVWSELRERADEGILSRSRAVTGWLREVGAAWRWLPPVDELADLLPEMRAFQEINGEIVARLTPTGARRASGVSARGSGYEMEGTVAFRLEDGKLSSYLIELFDSRGEDTRGEARRMRRMVTFKNVDRVVASAPMAALQRLMP